MFMCVGAGQDGGVHTLWNLCLCAVNDGNTSPDGYENPYFGLDVFIDALGYLGIHYATLCSSSKPSRCENSQK